VQLQPKPPSDDSSCPPDWCAPRTLTLSNIYRHGADWLREQHVLIEAFWVAVTFHVLLFPLIWFAGWTLPWPKPPRITTVIEINLENWPTDARPERIEELYNYQLQKARKH
jgi:hypothetical protein